MLGHIILLDDRDFELRNEFLLLHFVPI